MNEKPRITLPGEGLKELEERAKTENIVRELNIRSRVLKDIYIERDSQNAKWGPQYHNYAYWYAILGEEFGEVGQAIQVGSKAHKSSDADNLYKELIQVAAVAAAIAEQVIEDAEKNPRN